MMSVNNFADTVLEKRNLRLKRLPAWSNRRIVVMVAVAYFVACPY